MYISQNYSFAILRPLQEQIKSMGGEVRWFLFGKEINYDLLNPEEYRLKSLKEVIDWKPDVCFVPGNTIPSFIPGIKVDVFHGFNSGKVNRRGSEDHFNIRGFFDIYCTQGPNTTERFKKLENKHQHFKVEETGWPALDPLFHNNKKNEVNEEEKNELPKILICSTFSRELSLAPKLYKEIKRLSESKKWKILIQFHPKMPLDIVKKYKALENENLTFYETNNLIPLLKEADVMLCDTSSALLMFLLQRKPVVTYCNQDPRPHLVNTTDKEKIEELIDYALKKPSELMKEIEIYCQQLHPYTDGLSSKRVLNVSNKFLIEGTKLKKKPLNIIRNLKIRRQFDYWRLK